MGLREAIEQMISRSKPRRVKIGANTASLSPSHQHGWVSVESYGATGSASNEHAIMTGSDHLQAGDTVLVDDIGGVPTITRYLYNDTDNRTYPRIKADKIFNPASNTTFDVSSLANIGKAKVSSNDTTPGYLNGKLVAGSNITLTENNDGGNETLTIAAGNGGHIIRDDGFDMTQRGHLNFAPNSSDSGTFFTISDVSGTDDTRIKVGFRLASITLATSIEWEFARVLVHDHRISGQRSLFLKDLPAIGGVERICVFEDDTVYHDDSVVYF